MHSSLNRVQNVFGFFTSVAFAVAAAMAVSVLLTAQSPRADLELKNVRVAKGRPHYYSTKREEYAHVTFDLDADLTSLFNWNTKQIFLYITVSYPSTSSSTPPSEAIIWDAIIPATSAPSHPNTYTHPDPKTGKKPSTKSSSKSKKSKTKKSAPVALPYPPGTEPGILRLAGQKPKYQITDISGLIAGREDAVLTLHWNVQPWVGALVWANHKGSIGLWKPLEGGTSQSFDFPALQVASGTETKKDELKTETGAEARRGSPA